MAAGMYQLLVNTLIAIKVILFCLKTLLTVTRREERFLFTFSCTTTDEEIWCMFLQNGKQTTLKGPPVIPRKNCKIEAANAKRTHTTLYSIYISLTLNIKRKSLDVEFCFIRKTCPR